MSEQERTAALFLQLDRPCEEKLKRLAEAYNSLADDWMEMRELLATAQAREREHLPEIEQVITDILLAVDAVADMQLDGPDVDAVRLGVERELKSYFPALASGDQGEP